MTEANGIVQPNADNRKAFHGRNGELEMGSAISRTSIAAFIATLVETLELRIKENLGFSKP
ncbi:hypothetical protein INQ51_20975 [Maribellus sp. CM-23]|uniref:hypothetical protein n=1 Tax=Maribellus sp. CM-23 TaxID=2781026 RepID=UPI001F42FD64|nr:hypothetical protein [Maribellus sp. CM-23]MCE4566808.1 hypothetical protein [Maribellus sp. CM-23]